jgi:hypothetical protein
MHRPHRHPFNPTGASLRNAEMLDITTLLPLISGVISASTQLGIAARRWYESRVDRRTQREAYQVSKPTDNASTAMLSLMDVQSSYWKANPAMLQALGVDGASNCARNVVDYRVDSDGVFEGGSVFKFAGGCFGQVS